MLSALNVLGIYCQRRYIPRKDVLEFWARPVLRLMPTAEAFLAHRDQMTGMSSWPQLRELAEDSARYLRRQGLDIVAVQARAGSIPPPPDQGDDG